MYTHICLSPLVLYLTLLHTTSCFFFFNVTATTEIYTLSLHDALPISLDLAGETRARHDPGWRRRRCDGALRTLRRSEEHTSELQSHVNLVCRLLLEKKKQSPRPPAPRPP